MASALGGGESPFGIHDDLMKAEAPSDPGSLANLIQELKDRGRGCVASKQYRAAEMLYGKGLEMKPDAILYSNRALARLSQNKHAEALEDSNAAIKLDSTYAKAFYRKAQACLKLKRPVEAVRAVEAGMEVAPAKEQKAMKELLDKAIQAADQAARKGKADTPSPSSTPSMSPVQKSPKKVSSSVSKNAAEGGKAEGGAAADDSDNEDEAPLSGVRGYKKKDDGRVTTYFNNDLTEEAKALIGDIAPKRIATESPPPPQSGVAVPSKTSAWNKAGTWEEKDCTNQCIEMLREKLTGVSCGVPDSTSSDSGPVDIVVSKVSNIKGDAQITHSRGKRRCLFDFSLDVEWKAELSCGTIEGKLHYPDISYGCDGEYEAQLTANDKNPAAASSFVGENIRRSEGKLQAALAAALDQFTADFVALPY